MSDGSLAFHHAPASTRLLYAGRVARALPALARLNRVRSPVDTGLTASQAATGGRGHGARGESAAKAPQSEERGHVMRTGMNVDSHERTIAHEGCR